MTRIQPRAIPEKAKEAARRAKAKEKVRVKERGAESEISLAIPLAPTSKRASVICMFDTDNVPTTTARIPTYPKIKSSVHLGKAARISGIRPARATMRTRVHADAVKGKEKERAGKARGIIALRREEKAKDGKSIPPDLELQQVKSRPRWCPANLKGNCPKGDMCPYPHLDEDAVSKIKSSDARRKEVEKEKNSDKQEDRGRSLSRDKKGKKWRNNSAGSD